MLLDPTSPYSAIVGHSPPTWSDRLRLALALLSIAVLGGGVVAVVAFQIARWVMTHV